MGQWWAIHRVMIRFHLEGGGVIYLTPRTQGEENYYPIFIQERQLKRGCLLTSQSSKCEKIIELEYLIHFFSSEILPMLYINTHALGSNDAIFLDIYIPNPLNN